MIAPLTNHLWQSTVFAAAIALLAAALRRNRAQVRYWVWLAASVKFLVPFAFVMTLGARLAPAPTAAARTAPPPTLSLAVDRAAQPFTTVFVASAETPQSPARWLPALVAGVWFAGCALVVIARLRDWRRVRAAVRAATPIELPGLSDRLDARSVAGPMEPGVVGVWRPLLLVPADIATCLSRAQLDAVVAHELCHVRRRDNLTAAIHMLVEAAFWFHPLVWWIGARLVDERERACDEAVLRQGLDPGEYAAGILNICKLYVESPLACVAGVTGADIKKRIEAIMSSHHGLNLNRARKSALAAASVAALTAPVLAGAITAPLHQDPPKFEVASIRPCENGPVVPGGRGGGGGPVFSPGRFVFNCGTLQMLINAAYIQNGEPLLNDGVRGAMGARDAQEGRIRGGPDWVRTERYTIEAKTDASTGRSGREAQPERKLLMGSMLRALLEERFQLKLHRETQDDVPMYALTEAKGGFKLKPVGPDGGCVAWERDKDEAPRAHRFPSMMEDVTDMIRRGEKPPCGVGVMGTERGSNEVLALNGQEMNGVAAFIGTALDRPVLNQTGIEGKFILYLEYAPDEHTPHLNTGKAFDPATADPSGPNIFAALEKLGLKLEPAKGPKGYIVIDRAERPSNR